MDARPGSGEAAGAATAEAAVQQPVAYPHLWFDDRGRPWIDEKNSVRLASALSASAAQAAHAPLAFVRDHVGDGQKENGEQEKRQYPDQNIAKKKAPAHTPEELSQSPADGNGESV